MWKQDHLTTLTYHNKYIIPMLYKIYHSFADNPSHAVPQALAIASELAMSLRHWSNIDNWHAECAVYNFETKKRFIFEKLDTNVKHHETMCRAQNLSLCYSY